MHFTNGNAISIIRSMNSKLIASLAALITSLCLVWLALVMTGVFPHYKAQIAIDHNLHSDPYGIDIHHSGDLSLSQFHY
jgi:hypothetical protein